MMCDSLERRRALLDKQVARQPSGGKRTFISDRELLDHLLRLEREMEQETMMRSPKRAIG